MRQARWTEFFKQFDMEINFTPGKANTAADALSRRKDYQDENVVGVEITIGNLQEGVREQLQQAYKNNEYGLKNYNQICEGDELVEGGVRWLKRDGFMWK